LNILITNVFRSVCAVIFFLSAVVLISCNDSVKNDPDTTDIPALEDSAVNFNHEIVKSEIQEIDDFISRYGWKMSITQTGLRYMIYKKGAGSIARQGDIVGVLYKITLLNGDMVFETGPASIVKVETGKRTVVSGLEEGIMLMKKGERAKLIVPSHLAYGLLGDLEKIPARAVLVYDVEVCSINPPGK
jgi:FKBP-type peptidyl-prolyl cis-trans isomerase FkpA